MMGCCYKPSPFNWAQKGSGDPCNSHQMGVVVFIPSFPHEARVTYIITPPNETSQQPCEVGCTS